MIADRGYGRKEIGFRARRWCITSPVGTAPCHFKRCRAASRAGDREKNCRSPFPMTGGKVESSSAFEIAKHTLLSGGLILAVGTITGFVARKIRVPDIALFLIVGMAIGPAVLGLIDIKADSALYQIILVDGGASLRFEVLKRVWITIVLLATLGVLVTAAITAFAAHGVLGVSWIVALLLGTTIASTEPATLVPIFRQIKIRDRVAQ